MEREGHIDRHAIARMRMPKVPKKLVTPLDPDQVKRLLSAPDTRTLGGIRDVAVLSVLLDCGLRVSELCGLGLGDVDQRAGTLKVFGKGSKERMVGFGAATNKALTRWLQARPAQLAERRDCGRLFLGQYGVAISRHAVEEQVRWYGQQAGLGVRCYPHLLRHTFAVSFIRAGGDAFTLQQLLGHTSLETVKLYVNLAQTDVLTAYRRASPLDNL
jgi:site-specific recombinase XerD